LGPDKLNQLGEQLRNKEQKLLTLSLHNLLYLFPELERLELFDANVLV
jgi:hypothetical protein